MSSLCNSTNIHRWNWNRDNRDYSRSTALTTFLKYSTQQWNTFASVHFCTWKFVPNRAVESRQEAGKVWKYVMPTILPWIDCVSRIIDMIDEHQRMKMVRFILTIGEQSVYPTAAGRLIYSKGQIKSREEGKKGGHDYCSSRQFSELSFENIM